MNDQTSMKRALAFAAVVGLCVALASIPPTVKASRSAQGACPVGCGSCGFTPCCSDCDTGPPASCKDVCTYEGPGGPTTTPAPAATLPPLTMEARATEESIWATSWAVTAEARETMVVEATQTTVAGIEGAECFSCYRTDECDSGWATVCFIEVAGGLVPYRLECQAASECEPSGGPGEPECVPGTAWTPELGLDPCEGWEWTWDLRVMADVPPHIVQVRPFPRWIVGMGAPLPAPYESGSPGTLTLQDYPALSNFPGVCQPNSDSEGCWSQRNNKPDPIRTDPETGEEAPLPGDIKDFRVGLRWRRIDIIPGDDDPGGAPATCWDWDERDWNIGQDYGYGPIPAVTCGKSVSHIYETSSYGKPANGPNFIPAEDTCTSWTPACDSGSTAPRCHCCEQIPSSMADWRRLPSFYDFDPAAGPWQNPAYQVRVPTYWALEWAAEWYQWDVVGRKCECAYVPGWGTAACDLDDDGVADPDTRRLCEDEYGWRHHDFADKRWNLVDLRNYGKGTWYHTSHAVRTTGSYAGCAFEYGDPNPGNSVRIPVIEVQSVLRDPCHLDGTCPER
jgi:hypothetical protein